MGKKILITGGTGSLGKALTQELISDPEYSEIVIFSRDEDKQQEMKDQLRSDKLRFIVGDVKDFECLSSACRGIEEVIHAAALKRVGGGEEFPEQYIHTNIMGTINVIKVCELAKIKKAILISTDKAVLPINLYGATKLCGEKLFVRANSQMAKTQFSIVRYGNVIGSNGSVVHRWNQQKIQGEKPSVVIGAKRFWLPLRGASKVVKECLQVMQGGEIFIIKSPSFSVLDLYNAMHMKKFEEIDPMEGEKRRECLLNEEEAGICFETLNFLVLINDKDNKRAIKKWKKQGHLTNKRNYIAGKEHLGSLKEFVAHALSR